VKLSFKKNNASRVRFTFLTRLWASGCSGSSPDQERLSEEDKSKLSSSSLGWPSRFFSLNKATLLLLSSEGLIKSTRRSLENLNKNWKSGDPPFAS
jgi:hypothetical protein